MGDARPPDSSRKPAPNSTENWADRIDLAELRPLVERVAKCLDDTCQPGTTQTAQIVRTTAHHDAIQHVQALADYLTTQDIPEYVGKWDVVTAQRMGAPWHGKAPLVHQLVRLVGPLALSVYKRDAERGVELTRLRDEWRDLAHAIARQVEQGKSPTAPAPAI